MTLHTNFLTGSRRQFHALRRLFDELDEGTAIFKTTSNAPIGTDGFLTEPQLPSDHYLWLTGTLGRALRKEIPLTPELPKR